MKIRNQLAIGTCIILMNDKNQILLGKRKNGYKEGYFGLPGGRLEMGEPLKTCIRRELFEETGLKFETLSYIGVIRETQVEEEFIHFVFFKKNVKEKPINKEKNKCEGWMWIDMNKIPKLKVLPGHKASIELWQKNRHLKDLHSENKRNNLY